MKVSTSLFFDRSTNQMIKGQSELAKTQTRLSKHKPVCETQSSKTQTRKQKHKVDPKTVRDTFCENPEKGFVQNPSLRYQNLGWYFKTRLLYVSFNTQYKILKHRYFNKNLFCVLKYKTILLVCVLKHHVGFQNTNTKHYAWQPPFGNVFVF